MRVYYAVTEPAVIEDIRERLNISTAILQQIVLQMEITTNSHSINKNTTSIESIITNITDITEEVNDHATIIAKDIEKTADSKDQSAIN